MNSFLAIDVRNSESKIWINDNNALNKSNWNNSRSLERTERLSIPKNIELREKAGIKISLKHLKGNRLLAKLKKRLDIKS